MITINYKKLARQIKRSPFKDGFDEITIGRKIYYSPNGKYLDELEYRDLSLLAIFPYVSRIAILAARKFVWCYQDNAYMTIDDFVQDIMEALICNWHKWKPEKFKLTTMAHRLGLCWIFNNYRFRKIAENVSRRVYNFVAEEGMEGMDDHFSKHHSEDARENGTYDLNSVEDKILLDGVLKQVKEVLTQRQYWIFKKKYMEGWSYEKIGKYMGLSKERIRQLLYGHNNNGKLGKAREYVKYNKENIYPHSIQGRINKLKRKYMGFENLTMEENNDRETKNG